MPFIGRVTSSDPVRSKNSSGDAEQIATSPRSRNVRIGPRWALDEIREERAGVSRKGSLHAKGVIHLVGVAFREVMP